jgi:TatD DNase family protein
MPEDRVLTETDGPFTTNGTRPLEPSDSSLTTPALSKIWHGSSEDVEHRLADNLKRLVNSVSDVKDNKVRVSGLFGK